MLIFPQLSTGASAQYPIQKRRSERTILNISEDGRPIALADDNAKTLTWNLAFQGLTDEELLKLTSFYQVCEGSLQSFLFLDPTQNLFEYSEDFSQSAWTYNALLTALPGIDDPIGSTRASRLTNNSGATLNLTQTVGVPGSIHCAFSAYLRLGPTVSVSDGVQMTRTDGSTIDTLVTQCGNTWRRFGLSSIFASSISATCDFSVSVPSGLSLDVFGLQVEAQPNPGTYVSSTSETGIFPNARFNSNEIVVVATDVGQSSVKLSVIARASV